MLWAPFSPICLRLTCVEIDWCLRVIGVRGDIMRSKSLPVFEGDLDER